MQPLLDPSRLKPPTQILPQELRNSQLNLSIGLQHQQQLDDENEIMSISHIKSIPKIEMLWSFRCVKKLLEKKSSKSFNNSFIWSALDLLNLSIFFDKF